MAFTIALLLMAASPSDAEAVDLAARLRACGFSEVVAVRDPVMGDDAVAMVADAQADDQRLECAARLEIDTGAIIEMSGSLRDRYSAISEPLVNEASARVVAQMRPKARQWFVDRGHHDTIPDLGAGKIVASEIKPLIGKLCGRNAVEMVKIGSDYIEILPLPTFDSDTTVCILQFIVASGQTRFGFIGNAASALESGASEDSGDR